MNRFLKLITILLFTAAMLISSCSTPEKPVDPVDVDEITVYFEPDNCIYEGPTVITPGEFTLIFENTTETNASINIYQLDEGKTWDDWMEIYSEGSKGIRLPSWASGTSYKPDLSDPRLMEYDLEPGIYVMSAMEITEGNFIDYPCSPLEVR